MEVEFISKKRYANYEGCKFHLFTFKTSDENEINMLRSGKLFNKDYREIGAEEPPKEKSAVDEIAELEALIKQKKIDAGLVPNEPIKDFPEETDNAQFDKMIDSLDYDELKDMVKEAMGNGSPKISLNAGKEALRKYLKEG